MRALVAISAIMRGIMWAAKGRKRIENSRQDIPMPGPTWGWVGVRVVRDGAAG